MAFRHPAVFLCAMLALTPVAPRNAVADEPVPLTGSVTLYEELCPEGPKSGDCVLSFFIEGEAATRLYDGMHAEALREECTGGTQKTDGNGLNCIKADDGAVFCEFGYHFAEKRFGWGGLGC
jgi:hypothetical protein